MNQFKHAKWWRSYLEKSWQSFWKLKFMKNQALELHSPLPNSFKVCKERTKERGKTEWRKQRTAAAVFLRTFGALPEVHFLHSIYHFKAQEVKNPMLQTVHDSELKRRSYSHCKQITSSWRKIFARLRNQPFVARISQPFCTVQRNFSWSFPIFATDSFRYFLQIFLYKFPFFSL